MIQGKINNKKRLIVLFSLLGLLLVSYLVLVLYNADSLKKYNEIILPNTFVDGVDLSNLSYEQVKKELNDKSEYLLSREIKMTINKKEYTYKYSDVGIVIDDENTYKQIVDYQKKLNYSDKLMSSNGRVEKTFKCKYKVDNAKLDNFLNNTKREVEVEVINGYFDTSNGVSYHRGVPGYSLNIEKSKEVISKVLLNDSIKEDSSVELVGDSVGAEEIESYATIDTMTSSFMTVFTPNTYLRNINLNTALSYINGSIVHPGEVFSYCNKAGPFDKAGYVFYYEFVGNGVCQIATTTYNTALLGGLEIVKRYPHDKKSAYVAGGLDATVASYPSGWCVDMQFKNTYKYPIYIKAYSEGGRAHVEFWSNSQAKEGKEYTTESVWLGGRGYESYLHTFKDGQEISRDKIATTWYTKD